MRQPERSSVRGMSAQSVDEPPLENFHLDILLVPMPEGQQAVYMDSWDNTFEVRHSSSFRQNLTPNEIFEKFPVLKTNIGLEMVRNLFENCIHCLSVFCCIVNVRVKVSDVCE